MKNKNYSLLIRKYNNNLKHSRLLLRFFITFIKNLQKISNFMESWESTELWAKWILCTFDWGRGGFLLQSKMLQIFLRQKNYQFQGRKIFES